MNTGSVLAEFNVTLSKAVAEPVAVDWYTSDGTAKATVDYQPNKGTVLFAPGETSKKVQILVYGRAVGTEDRSFFVEMLPPTNAILGASIGECIIHVDTSGSQPVTQIIVPSGEKGDTGDSAYETWLQLPGNAGKTEQEFIDSLKPDPADIAQDVAPLIDVGGTTLTAEGTESKGKPDATTVKAVARRVAYAAGAKIATVLLAGGDNTLPQSSLTGDAVSFTSAGFSPRVLRNNAFITPDWSLTPRGELVVKGAVAGDVLYAVEYQTASKASSIAEIERQYDKAPYNKLKSFQAGNTVNAGDALFNDADNAYYIWNGAFPKVVPQGSTPASSGGLGDDKWKSVGKASALDVLAMKESAGIVGAKKADGSATTVQVALDGGQTAINDINSRLGDPAKTTGIVTRASNARFAKRFTRPHRLVNKTVPNDASLQYDHFGIMDRKADGSVYMSCRRALNHLSEGYVVFSELQPNGSWATRNIIQKAGIDMRGSSGGTAPTGDIVIALAKMQPDSNPNVFLGVEVYISRDDGQTFTQVADIPSPGVAGTYLLPFGKLEVLGNRWVIPCYSSTAYANNKLQLLESTDFGATWSVGATIVSGIDANEAAVLDCGDGVCICVARNGSGTVNNDGTHRPLVYRSGDGGITWSSVGEMRGPDWADNDASSEAGTAGGSGWQLVTPQLSLIHSKGGKPYILCTYTCRRSGVRYRTISVDQFTQSTATTTFWSEYNTAVNLMSPVETFESGYQSQFVHDDQLFINVFRTVTADTISTASQFQVLLPSLPDYDSGWFPVAQLQNYTFNHGLNCIPAQTEILFSDTDDGRGATFGCSPRLYYNGTTTVGAGIDWQVNLSGFTLRTGTYITFQGVFGSTVGPNRTSGFARLLAWK